MIDDLPLFSHRPASVDRTDPLRQTLKAIEPDALAPPEALSVLYELKEKTKE